jgi:hypothetical protein
MSRGKSMPFGSPQPVSLCLLLGDAFVDKHGVAGAVAAVVGVDKSAGVDVGGWWLTLLWIWI